MRRDRAFDRWLEAALTRSYGAVLDEDLPDELVALAGSHPRRYQG